MSKECGNKMIFKFLSSNFMLRNFHLISYYTILCGDMLSYAMQCYVSDAILHYAYLCDAMLCYAMHAGRMAGTTSMVHTIAGPLLAGGF